MQVDSTDECWIIAPRNKRKEEDYEKENLHYMAKKPREYSMLHRMQTHSAL